MQFPVLTTDRLTLRQLKDTDEQAIFTLRSNDEVNKYIDRKKPKSIEEARAFIEKINDSIKQNLSIYWAICLKESPELIGTICLWNFSKGKTTAELGYELLTQFHGKGIMNEAVKSVLDYNVQFAGFRIIEAFTHKDNERSISLLIKNNFKPIPERKDEGNPDNLIFVMHVIK